MLFFGFGNVTPFAGVWIEICIYQLINTCINVTPFAGVWIEIFSFPRFRYPLSCHSLRGSVDWNSVAVWLRTRCIVTPFAGVWIEIIRVTPGDCETVVTPFAGVWIEISVSAVGDISPFVTPFAGVWIEIFPVITYFLLATSLPSRECGLKYIHFILLRFLIRHSLRGSVDWNSGNTRNMKCRNSVTPFAGVWIEIESWSPRGFLLESLPSRECGLKFFRALQVSLLLQSLPSRECGLK